MPSYGSEFKEQAVRKLMPPHNRTVASLSREIGISQASLYNWKKQFRAWPTASGFSTQNVPVSGVLQRQIGIHALQPGVLRFQFAQAL